MLSVIGNILSAMWVRLWQM